MIRRKSQQKAWKKRFNKRRIEQENKQRKNNQTKAKHKKYNASNRGKKEKVNMKEVQKGKL